MWVIADLFFMEGCASLAAYPSNAVGDGPAVRCTERRRGRRRGGSSMVLGGLNPNELNERALAVVGEWSCDVNVLAEVKASRRTATKWRLEAKDHGYQICHGPPMTQATDSIGGTYTPSGGTAIAAKEGHVRRL